MKLKFSQTGIKASWNGIHLQLNKLWVLQKNLVGFLKEQNLQTFVLHPIFALMLRNEDWWNLIYFVAYSTQLKVSSTKKKQIVNILVQKLIWQEVCLTNSMTLLEVNKIQQSSYLGCHATLYRNRNLQKVVYKKLEK